MSSNVQHFLRLDDLSSTDLIHIIDRAIELKKHSTSNPVLPLAHKSLAMIFAKSSTRTRVSFEVAMRQLGGGAINLSPHESQLGRGESIEDTARVLSSMVDAILVRTDNHNDLVSFAENSSVPVINGLTDDFHPCQLLADMQTIKELKGSIKGLSVAWVGDGNNVCNSWMNAARLFEFDLRVASPDGYRPNADIVALNDNFVSTMISAKDAVAGADVVVTDTWVSMGQEGEKQQKRSAFEGFCVNGELMAVADSKAIFMHCLPAYRGDEVSSEVIDGVQSAVFQEAENRLHAQKSLLEFLLT